LFAKESKNKMKLYLLNLENLRLDNSFEKKIKRCQVWYISSNYRVSSKLWLFEKVTRLLNFPSSEFWVARQEFVSEGDDEDRFSVDDFATEVIESDMVGRILLGTDTGMFIWRKEKFSKFSTLFLQKLSIQLWGEFESFKDIFFNLINILFTLFFFNKQII